MPHCVFIEPFVVLQMVGTSMNCTVLHRTTVSFDIFGPFDLPETNLLSSEKAATDFSELWTQVEARRSGLKSAYGCFLFVSLHRGRTLPWVVGGSPETPFVEACVTAPMRRRYRKVLTRFPDATPQLMLLPYSGKLDAFDKPKGSKRMEFWFMKTLLTGLCMNRNADLLDSDRSSYRRCTAAGEVIQARQKSTIDHRALRSALGLV